MVTGLGGVQFTLFVKNICQKRKKGKEKRMTLFYSSELACRKQRLNCHSSPLQLGSSFFPLFYDIFVSGTQTQGYKLVVKYAILSHWYINILIPLADMFFKLRRAYAALYCGPIVSQSFFDKI